MKECDFCDDPKGDIMCERCADEMYGHNDVSDEEAWQFGIRALTLAFAAGLVLGSVWNQWVVMAGW